MLLVALSAAVVVLQNGQAQTLACGEARSRVERLLCADPETSRLAANVDEAYRTASAKRTDARALAADQREWRALWTAACPVLDRPDDSGAYDEPVECMKPVLTHRLEVLNGGLAYRGADRAAEASRLENPSRVLPTSVRRKYTLNGRWISMLGDFYMSHTELLVTRIRGVIKLAFAGYMPDKPLQPDIADGRVYRVLNDGEIRSLNTGNRRYAEWFGCRERIRWLIVSVRRSSFGATMAVSVVYAHDYLDLGYRSFGKCGTIYVDPPRMD